MVFSLFSVENEGNLACVGLDLVGGLIVVAVTCLRDTCATIVATRKEWVTSGSADGLVGTGK
jgi:hypothetical protein